jgi:hypothetical protein
MLTLYKGEIKGKKNYEAKFSTISILKDETGKNKFKKSITIITKIQQKQKKKKQNSVDYYCNPQCNGCE